MQGFLSNLEFIGWLAVVVVPILGVWAWLIYLNEKGE
jgi:hypothetical protein